MTGSPELGRETIMGWVKLALCVKISKTVRDTSKVTITWIGLCSVLRPRQHSIGYMGDGVTITD